MRIRNVTLAVSAIAILGTVALAQVAAGLGMAVYAQPKPVSSRTSVVVYKSPT